MKRKINKNVMQNISQHVKGRFFTIKHESRNKVNVYCAKMVRESAQYITIMDMATGDNKKMNKDSLVAVACGDFSYQR
jgi:uncharacterized repeat protein (TIGR04076 family)